MVFPRVACARRLAVLPWPRRVAWCDGVEVLLRSGVASFSVLHAYLAPLYFGRTVDLSAVAVDVGGFFEGFAAGLDARQYLFITLKLYLYNKLL